MCVTFIGLFFIRVHVSFGISTEQRGNVCCEYARPRAVSAYSVSIHCNTLQQLQHTATHCNTLQHTATHCNTLQHRGSYGVSFIGLFPHVCRSLSAFEQSTACCEYTRPRAVSSPRVSHVDARESICDTYSRAYLHILPEVRATHCNTYTLARIYMYYLG